SGQSEDRGQTHPRNAGKRRNPPLRFIAKVNDRLVVGILQLGEGDLRRQNMVRIETRVDVLETDKTLHEQASAGEENESKRDFRDDEGVPQTIATLAHSRIAPAFF